MASVGGGEWGSRGVGRVGSRPTTGLGVLKAARKISTATYKLNFKKRKNSESCKEYNLSSSSN